MNIAIITGASSGMGREFALQMDEHFRKIDEFWLIARREEELMALSGVLSHKTRLFAMDLTEMGQLKRLEHAIRLDNAKVCMLINCAGYGIMGNVSSASLRETLGMIRLNCEALTELTKRILPYASSNARIIQLASAAAFLPQPDFAVYAASKAYVFSFSRALGQELKFRRIYVTAVCPGPVNTPFFEVAEKHGGTLSLKKHFMAPPEKVVAKALRDSLNKKSVSVYGASMQAFQVLAKLMPQELLLSGMAILKKLESCGKGDLT